MSPMVLFSLRWVDVRDVGELAEFSLLLLAMVGRLPQTATSLEVNAGLPDPEIFVHHLLLVSWFISGLGPAYILFDTSARFRFGTRVGVGGVLNLLQNYLEVTFLESLWRKFIKLVGFHLGPLELLITGFFLLPKALSDRVVVSNSAANIPLHVFCIIAGAVRVGGVLGVRHPRSLSRGEESWFNLWGFLDLFTCFLQNSSAGEVWFVIGAEGRLELILSYFMGLPPEHLILIHGVKILVEPLIANQVISVIFKVKFVLHGLMQSILDGISYYLFRNNFVAILPVGL